jgi:DNA-binding MarR family transcriptional regulator
MQPAPTEPPKHWAAWQMFFEAHAAVCARLEAELHERHGLSLRWYDVLLHLYAAPTRRLTMGELGDAVVISKSGLTGLVDRMRRAGLVTRRGDRHDRRVVQVTLTAAGAEVYERARADHRRGVQDGFLRHLTAAEAVALDRGLGRVLAENLGASPPR